MRGFPAKRDEVRLSVAPEQYFLLIYDLKTRSVEVKPFDQDFEAAAAEYSMMEERHHDDSHIEVVLVGADSIETIHKTHSHYFEDASKEILQQFLAV